MKSTNSSRFLIVILTDPFNPDNFNYKCKQFSNKFISSIKQLLHYKFQTDIQDNF